MKPTTTTTEKTAVRPILRLTESAVMLALATVLSLLPLLKLPYGGSITVASMLPLVIIAFRYGTAWGCLTGFAYGLLQLVLDSSLSYVTGFWSVLAVIVLDFGAAFAAIGLAGVFRHTKSHPVGLTFGAILVCVVRYGCHVLSGATVWAGISIPTAAALAYSFAYNATYMLPETIITAAAAYFLGSVLDFRSPSLVRLPRQHTTGLGWLKALAVGLCTVAVVYDVVAIFPYMQDAETGWFTVARLGEVAWTPVAVVTLLAAVVSAVLFLVSRRRTDTPAD